MERLALFCSCLAVVSCSKQGAKEPVNADRIPVYINEVFAASANGPAGHDANRDWLELYNAGTAIPLGSGEWFLTDDRDDLLKFELPGITLGEKGHLRIWCDGKDELKDHANFRLSSKGEWLGLVRVVHGRPDIMDSVQYAPQHGGSSMTTSRCPDGTDVWQTRSPSTPGAPNVAPLHTQKLATTAERAYDH